jgi:hypothetical protein
MPSDGTCKELVVQVAVWFVAESVTAPQLAITVPLEVKLTVPVGVTVNDCVAETVAVKVTAWFTDDGEPDEVTASVVFAGATVWVTLFEVAVT